MEQTETEDGREFCREQVGITNSRRFVHDKNVTEWLVVEATRRYAVTVV